MTIYPDICLQNIVPFDWWVKYDGPEFRPGRLVWAFLPYIDQDPRTLISVERGGDDGTSHDKVNYTLHPLSIKQVIRYPRLPTAALPNKKNEVYTVYRAKRRPAIIISKSGKQVEKEFKEGKANYQFKPTVLVIPSYGADEGSRSGYNPLFLDRVRRCNYPQIFWDTLPISSKTEESILRLDQLQPVGNQNIIEESDDIIWTTDLNINTTYVSPSIEKKLGFTPEERMGQSLEEQMPSSSYKAVMDRLAQELEKENDENVDPNRRIRMEVEYYHKNSSILWFEIVASGLRDENGALTGIHGISRDITDKIMAEKTLRESEEKYKLIAENSADVIYKLSFETEQCTYASPSVEGLLGYTVKESLSLKAQDILTADSYAKQRDRLIKSIESGYRNSVTLELDAIHKDGHRLPVEINANFIFDENGIPVEILGVARDITERKQVETELLAEKNKLEDALLEIKKLSGMLPICSSCKNIRDDKGYWNQIETYIKEHSEAEFTHSICPECAKKLYPDLDIHNK